MYTAAIVIKSIRAIPQYNNQLVVGSWSGSARLSVTYYKGNYSRVDASFPMYIPARQRMLFRARFARKRRPCFSSTSLNVLRLNVDMVVKAPSIPTARNSLDDSGRAIDFSALYVMKLSVKEPKILTPRVPCGNRDGPCMAVDSMNLNTAPMKPPSPT